MTEKSVEFPPAYVVPMQSAKSSTKSKGLLAWAVAATAAVVVIVIIGSVYYFRTMDTLTDAIKKYSVTDNSGNKPVKQDIELDTSNNAMTFRLTGDGVEPGTFAVVDYGRSLAVIYDPKSKSCYVIAGLRKDLVDPTMLNYYLAKNTTMPQSSMSYDYQVADTYPVSDKSILPSQIQKACAYLPTYWMEPQKGTAVGKVKRQSLGVDACLKVCLQVLVIGICAQLCVGITLDLGGLGGGLG